MSKPWSKSSTKSVVADKAYASLLLSHGFNPPTGEASNLNSNTQGTTAATKLGLESAMTPGRFEANCSNNMFLFLMSLQRTLEIISCSTIVL